MSTDEKSPPSDTPQKTPRLHLRPRTITLWSLLLLLILIPWAIREYRLSRIPLIPEPFDVNAHRESMYVPPEQNAFVEYHLAIAEFQKIPQKEWPKYPDNPVGLHWRDYPDHAHDFIDKSQAAFEIWLAGTRKPRAAFLDPEEVKMRLGYKLGSTGYRLHSMAEQNGNVWRLRVLAQFGLWKALSLQDAGKLDEAWEWHFAVERTALHLSMCGLFDHRLVGMGIKNVGSPYLHRWAEDPRVTAAQLQKCIAEIEKLNSQIPVPSHNLKTEYRCIRDPTRRFAYALYDLPSDRDSNLYLNPFSLVRRTIYKSKHFYSAVIGDYEIVSRLLKLQFQNWLSHVDLPSPERRKLFKKFNSTSLFLDERSSGSKLTPDQIDGLMAKCTLISVVDPELESFLQAVDRDLARRGELEIMLALQAHHRDQGCFPSELTLLIPKYLPQLPENPYSDEPGRPFLYRRESDHAVVWNIGEYEPVPPEKGPQYNPVNQAQGSTIFWTIYPPGTRPPLYRPLPEDPQIQDSPLPSPTEPMSGK